LVSLPHLVAATYHRKMGSGRTKPALFGCEDEQGDPAGEFVVKFKGGLEAGVKGLTCELLSSLIADHLGIPSPAPALIKVDVAIADLIPRSDADVGEVIRKSAGLNFGSRVLVGGFRTWPVDKPIPLTLRQTAVELFAFDALVQNPDRRYMNPNLLWRDDEIFAIDHDAAFSFLLDIGKPADPWNLETLNFLEQHVFFRGLKGEETNIDRFTGALEAMTDERISDMAETVPPEWRNQHLTRILGHLESVREHARDFAEQIKRRLA